MLAFTPEVGFQRAFLCECQGRREPYHRRYRPSHIANPRKLLSRYFDCFLAGFLARTRPAAFFAVALRVRFAAGLSSPTAVGAAFRMGARFVRSLAASSWAR